MATLTMHHVHKTYPNGHVAVPDLTLDVGDGEFLVLVGPSGCGKSTVLRMIAGLEEVTTGELRIEGRVVNSMEPRGERDIAMVFQSYALYPTMTVAENIAFAMRLRKTDKRVMAAKVAEVAELLELTPVLDRKPGQLSGGQRQRVAMGRAIVREPKLFLMDEPLSNLDAQLRVQTRAEISKIQRRLGVTTVYVTHDQVEAMTMGDRVAVLRRGELMQCATPGELYGAPANLFVAQFIGSPSMNVLRATVSAADDGAITLAVGEQQLHVDGAAAARLAPLRAMVGRDVAIGLRPEALGDDGAASLDVEVDLVEVLGSSQLAHCTLAAAPVRAADEGVAVGDAPATIVAALDPRAQVRAGERRTLAVDVLRLHVFDLATGDAIAGS